MKVYIILSALIILLIILELCNKKNYDGKTTTVLTQFNHDHDSCCNVDKIMQKCRVPNLSQEKCYTTKDPLCPRYNGSYKQCTNNYLPPQNKETCPCDNRTFEMCPHDLKVSQKCVNENIEKCKKGEINTGSWTELGKSRVNQWSYRGEDKRFMIQCNNGNCPILY